MAADIVAVPGSACWVSSRCPQSGSRKIDPFAAALLRNDCLCGYTFYGPRDGMRAPLKGGDLAQILRGPEGATVVATWIVDKNVPMSTPAP
jgi:hypothetical protein